MSSITRSRALAPDLWWFEFSADIDIASAQDRLKYTFEGEDEVMLHVLQVFLGDTDSSVFVKTSPATEQQYTVTVSGLMDSQGEVVDDLIEELLPDVLPAYPPTGIISLSADGEGWGSKLRASTEYWSKLIGINGIAGAMVYPFTHSVENPADYEMDTAVLGEPVSELAIRPIAKPEHASEFTSDQTADLVVAVPPSRLLPDFGDLYMRNTSRPGDDTITIIDGIVVIGEIKAWRRYRGMELMIARLGDPEDLISILPYYPPGTNDPNSPNYDPNAPEDGSANPPWRDGPTLPEKLPFFPWDTKKPPAVELLVPGDFDPGFAKPCPYAPPDIVIPPVTVTFPDMNLSELEIPAGDHTIIARIYNELNDYTEATVPLSVIPPVIAPGVVTRGRQVIVERMSEIVASLDLVVSEVEYPFSQDTSNPDLFSLDTSDIPSGIHSLRANYSGNGSGSMPLTLREFVSRCRVLYIAAEDIIGEGRSLNPSDRVKLKAKVKDTVPVIGVEFWLKPIVEGGWGTPKVILGSATESNEEEGVFELDTSLSEATQELEHEEFQVGADITLADSSIGHVVAGSSKPRKHPKPTVSRKWSSPTYKSREGTDIDAIVLHHTAGPSAASAASRLCDPNSEVSAHYLIDNDSEGTIYQLVDDKYRANHARGKLDGEPVNSRSIGIEIVNWGNGEEFTEAQYESLNKLIDYLQEEYDIPDENIVAHRQVSIRGAPDPAKSFNWERVVPGGPSGAERKPGDRYHAPTPE